MTLIGHAKPDNRNHRFKPILICYSQRWCCFKPALFMATKIISDKAMDTKLERLEAFYFG
jgi:hypothetical protein